MCFVFTFTVRIPSCTDFSCLVRLPFEVTQYSHSEQGYSFSHFLVLITCMCHSEVFFHSIIRKCILITLSAFLLAQHFASSFYCLQVPRCFFTSYHVLNIYSQKQHRLVFLHMFGNFVFLHLEIRNCLLITKPACVISRCFITSYHVLNIYSQKQHRLVFLHMYGNFVFLPLSIRSCLSITLPACAFPRCFFT